MYGGPTISKHLKKKGGSDLCPLVSYVTPFDHHGANTNIGPTFVLNRIIDVF